MIAVRAACVIALVLCGAGPQDTRPATRPDAAPETRPAIEALAGQVATAHNADGWNAKRAVEADLHVTFEGQVMLEAKMLYDPHGGRVRMETTGGTTLVFDGERAWVSPATDRFPAARFHLLTWPYFMAAPFKLGDPGARLSGTGIATLQGKAYRTTKLTFDSGTGDSPDDWYVLYTDLTSHKLGAMAYVVTYGTPADQAEADPHAITYHDFGIFNDVVLARRWQFWSWNEKDGIHGDPIGEAKLTSIRFPEPDDDAFVRPDDAREDALP